LDASDEALAVAFSRYIDGLPGRTGMIYEVSDTRLLEICGGREAQTGDIESQVVVAVLRLARLFDEVGVNDTAVQVTLHLQFPH
jgi:hypothetical protein